MMKLIFVAMVIIWCSSIQQWSTEALITLELKGRQIPTTGAGAVLITDIGPNNSDALLCQTTMSGHIATNWYYRYGESQQRRVQSDDTVLGWRRNRGRNPGVVRLRSRSSSPQPGQSKEGVYTCEVVGDGVVSVGLYYDFEMEMSFRLDPDILHLSYSVTCTVTGGTVLSSSFTGPGDVALPPLSPVGALQMTGQDTYTSSVTMTTGNHGDTFTCMASNGAATTTKNYTLLSALPPSNITWQQVAPSVVTLSWTQPEGGAPVRSYTMAALFGNGVVAAYTTLKSRSRETMIQRLIDDGREYRVTLVAMSDQLPGVASFTFFLTRLLPPHVIFSNVTSTTAILTLSPSRTLSAITPDSYVITMWRVGGMPDGCHGNERNRSISVSPKKLIVTVTGLEEASTYSVVVQTMSADIGDSPVSSPSLFNTSDSAPSEVPSGLMASEVTMSSVTLQWQPLTHCLNINGQPRGWQIQFWETENMERGLTTLSVQGNPLQPGRANVTGIAPGTNYSFQVAAVTGNDLVGMFSDTITAITLQDNIGRVSSLHVSSRNSTVVCVAWQPLYPSNGHVTSYLVLYWSSENREDSEKSVSVPGNETSVCLWLSDEMVKGGEVIVEVVSVGREGNESSVSIAVATVTPSYKLPDTVETEGEGGSGDGGLMFDGVYIQIQFGPTDHCAIWTEEKARATEKEIQVAVGNYMMMECPSCDQPIFQGQPGLFVCHDNPHMVTYRVCLGQLNSPLVPFFIQQWVQTEPWLKVGWILAKVNPHCPVEIPSLIVAEQLVAMPPTNQTLSLPAHSLELIDTCMTELQSLCNITTSKYGSH